MQVSEFLNTLKSNPLVPSSPNLIWAEQEITVEQKRQAAGNPYVRLQYSRAVDVEAFYGRSRLKQVNLDVNIYQQPVSSVNAPFPALVVPEAIVNLYKEIQYSLQREVDEFHMGALIEDGVMPGSGELFPFEQPDKSFYGLLTFNFRFYLP